MGVSSCGGVGRDGRKAKIGDYMSEQTVSDEQQTPANVEETSAKEAPKEELGDGGKKALDSERAARRDAEKQVKSASKRLAELEAELEKARSEADEAAAAKAELEHTALVREVAAESGLPEEAAVFLGEGDRDALVERAKSFRKIAEAMFAAKRPQPVPEAGRGVAAKRSTADQFADSVGPLFG